MSGTRSQMSISSVACIIALAAPGFGQGLAAETPEQRGASTWEESLRIAENDRLSREQRIAALTRIGCYGKEASEVLPRLLEMLPGEGDTVTLAVVSTIRKIGDPKALPKLRSLMKDRRPVKLHGKIVTEIMYAIRDLEAESARRSASGQE